MKYYCPTSSSMQGKPEEWGVITTPNRWGTKPIQEGRRWIADNGCFSEKWDRVNWICWLNDMQKYIRTCDFAVLPDVVGDHKSTMYLFQKYFYPVTSMGYNAAFVCQDGCVPQEIPYCHAIFIGGSTAWKLSTSAGDCISEGRKRGIPVHIGRVNSAKRYAHFLLQGATSFDGTSYCFAPIKITRLIEKWATMTPLTGIIQEGWQS
jgi:hypothetical protein